MEALLDAVDIDDVVKVNSILSFLETDAETENSSSNKESITFSTQDFQDAFVQAAFSGSIKSLICLGKYGKNIFYAFGL